MGSQTGRAGPVLVVVYWGAARLSVRWVARPARAPSGRPWLELPCKTTRSGAQSPSLRSETGCERKQAATGNKLRPETSCDRKRFSWERAGEPGYSTTVCRKRLWHATHIVTIPP